MTEAVSWPTQSGATYVFDKGYYNYNWWAKIDAQGAQFVTRFKVDAALKITASRPVPKEARGTILADETVCFTNKHPDARRRNHYTKALRRITVVREDKPPPW